jgi:acetyl/propionyl-CoA carboxylase alpha subunit
MQTKLLVANRSEIACRIFQTCREMGITPVGIVAPGDEEARHVTYADELQKVTSYLDIPSVIRAAQSSGAKLIHPGYGFLSERPAFAQAVENAGLIFVGPRAETMQMMGEKIAAKELAGREKIPTLPWARVERGGDIAAAAKKVGFPLLLKASAGGGGKGMRRVDHISTLLDAAESASAEALSAFGDGTLFLERLLDHPRHIEVQVFGDGMGGGVHLYERECSLQRRHQKVWEESPAPHLKPKTREGLYEAAMRLVSATRYRNAGTLEFLVDQEGNFFFLEMNTRLQVEHPVTELVTGVDLVRAQITLALFPEEPALKQSLSQSGHAIEVRLYAEDPAQGFIPTPGRIEKLRWPTGAWIRIESGIEEGQTVGTQFDSMLGKLIVWAQSREQAIQRLRFALDETVILGVGTNQNYLRSIVDHPAVQSGHVNTSFLGTHFGSFSPSPTSEDLDIWCTAKSKGIGQSFSSGFAGAGQSNASMIPSPWVAFAQKGKLA